MSIDENGKMLCNRCNGHGYVGTVKFIEKTYKILCPKCLGVRYLDWIQQTRVVRMERDALIIAITVDHNAIPDNYVFVYGGTAYFIKKEFIGKTVKGKVKQKWENIIMNVPFVRQNPELAELWSNKKQLWKERTYNI